MPFNNSRQIGLAMRDTGQKSLKEKPCWDHPDIKQPTDGPTATVDIDRTDDSLKHIDFGIDLFSNKSVSITFICC